MTKIIKEKIYLGSVAICTTKIQSNSKICIEEELKDINIYNIKQALLSQLLLLLELGH